MLKAGNLKNYSSSFILWKQWNGTWHSIMKFITTLPQRLFSGCLITPKTNPLSFFSGSFRFQIYFTWFSSNRTTTPPDNCLEGRDLLFSQWSVSLLTKVSLKTLQCGVRVFLCFVLIMDYKITQHGGTILASVTAPQIIRHPSLNSHTTIWLQKIKHCIEWLKNNKILHWPVKQANAQHRFPSRKSCRLSNWTQREGRGNDGRNIFSFFLMAPVGY